MEPEVEPGAAAVDARNADPPVGHVLVVTVSAERNIVPAQDVGQGSHYKGQRNAAKFLPVALCAHNAP